VNSGKIKRPYGDISMLRPPYSSSETQMQGQGRDEQTALMAHGLVRVWAAGSGPHLWKLCL
jgi:hypothetical protein